MTGDDEGRIKDKLIRVKQEWAKDGRLLTGRPDVGHVNRLPPGQREVKNWPVLDLGVQPNIQSSAWRLTVDGLVQNPMVWSLEEFMALPQEDFLSDIHCVTQWSRYDNHWRGVSARHLMELVRPDLEARHPLSSDASSRYIALKQQRPHGTFISKTTISARWPTE